MNSTIPLSKQFGSDVSSRSRAAQLRLQIVSSIQEATSVVVIDLAGVRLVSDSFADELFGILVQQFGDDWFRSHVKAINMLPAVRESILAAIALRLERAAV